MYEIACEKNSVVEDYLETNWKVEHNNKLRNVIEFLEKDPDIVRIQNKPLVLKWKVESEKRMPPSDQSDVSVISA